MSRRVVMAVLVALAVVLGACGCDGARQAPNQSPGVREDRPAFPVRISANRRYLVDQSGRPFFYAADTSWTMLSHLTVQDARRLIDIRKVQGFNAIQTILTPFTITDDGPRGTPFEGADLTRPVARYWEGIDQIMRYADEQGMLLYAAPLWMANNGGWSCQTGDCLPAPSVSAMRTYLTWIGKRYRDQPNLVWVMGGDDEIGRNRDVKQAGAVALRAVDPEHLMTYHPRWDEYGFSIEPWHDLNAFQKNDITAPYNYQQIRRAYELAPVKPVLQAEPPYEPRTAMQQGDVTTPGLNRRFGWWAALSGAMGVAYGGPPGAWKIGKDGPPDWTAIEREPAVHTGNIRRILAPLPWYELEPDWDAAVVTAGRGTYGGDDYATAGWARDGSLVVAFAPSARSFTVVLSSLRGPGTATWYDPVTGRPVDQGRPVGNMGNVTLRTPGTNAGGDDDWVLVVAVDHPAADADRRVVGARLP